MVFPGLTTALPGQIVNGDSPAGTPDPNSVVTVQGVAGGVPVPGYPYGSGKRTFAVVGRLAGRPYQASHVFGAAGRFQYLTIFHGAASTKLLRLKRVRVTIFTTTAAANVWIDLVQLTNATTPATGNPAVTPTPYDRGVAADATVLVLPTTQGTEGGLIKSAGFIGLQITTAPGAPGPILTGTYDLYPGDQWIGGDDPEARVSNAEGFAVVIDVSAATTVTAYIDVDFTEE